MRNVIALKQKRKKKKAGNLAKKNRKEIVKKVSIKEELKSLAMENMSKVVKFIGELAVTLFESIYKKILFLQIRITCTPCSSCWEPWPTWATSFSTMSAII